MVEKGKAVVLTSKAGVVGQITLALIKMEVTRDKHKWRLKTDGESFKLTSHPSKFAMQQSKCVHYTICSYSLNDLSQRDITTVQWIRHYHLRIFVKFAISSECCHPYQNIVAANIPNISRQSLSWKPQFLYPGFWTRDRQICSILVNNFM